VNVFYNFSLFFSYILLLLTMHFSAYQNRIMIFNNFRQTVYYFFTSFCHFPSFSFCNIAFCT